MSSCLNERSALALFPEPGKPGAFLSLFVPKLALERLEMRAHLGVGRAEVLDLADRAHHRRVIAVAEGATELGEAALEALLAEIHRDVTRERDALVAILREEVARPELEVVADDALDVVDAGFVRARARRGRELLPGEVEVDHAPEERRLRREADERAFELANVRADRLREVEDHLVRELDLLHLRLLAKDRDARLELGPWMSATRPHEKRETRRSSIRSSCCGYLSLVTMICLSAW